MKRDFIQTQIKHDSARQPVNIAHSNESLFWSFHKFCDRSDWSRQELSNTRGDTQSVNLEAKSLKTLNFKFQNYEYSIL